MLYAYPRAFRREFGREMQLAFRDGLRQAPDRGAQVRFAFAALRDWSATTLREHASGIWNAGRRAPKRGYVAEWAVTILIYLFATSTLVQAYVVPTGSMEGNIRIGDHLLVDRAAYAHSPLPLLPYRDVERGDIVVFKFPEDTRQTYVKRVVGLPGDRIRLDNKQVVRNGHALLEPYAQHVTDYRQEFRDDFPAGYDAQVSPRGREMLEKHVVNGEVVVPPDTLFVLGDNRDNSLDSRYWGFVPRENVIGRPLFVYWSFDAPTRDWEGWSVSHLKDVALHFFTKTRWERTLFVPKHEEARNAP